MSKKTLLLSNEYVVRIENKIASIVKSEIIRKNLDTLSKLLENEINISNFDIETVIKYLRENHKEIIDFSIQLLRNYPAERLFAGFSITYTLYLLFLKEGSKTDLINYLKKIRIPDAKEFASELIHIKENLKTDF